jgi:hypothetical protein
MDIACMEIIASTFIKVILHKIITKAKLALFFYQIHAKNLTANFFMDIAKDLSM